MPGTGSVDVTREGPVAVVTLNRPPVNALSVGLAARLGAKFRALDGDAEVRAIVVTGAGDKAFCAGGDIEEFAAMDATNLVNAVRAGQRLLWDLEHVGTPTIAAVNGACLGAGNGLAMACDLRIASEAAVFGHPEVSLGLTLAYAGSVRLARIVGLATAKELMLTGRRISAREALEIGMVNRVVPRSEARAHALAVAREIASRPPAAVRAAKKALTEGLEKHYPNSLVAEARFLSQVAQGEEVREALRSWVERQRTRP